MTDTPRFDPARLDELREVGAMTETPLVRMLLTTYLDGLGELSGRVIDGVLSGDAAAQKLAAHSLKSSSAQLGALRLSAVCQQLEHADAATARPLLDVFREELDAIRPILERERDQA